MARNLDLTNTNIVTEIIVMMDSKLLDENGDESEALGIAYLDARTVEGEGYWKQCSYNTVGNEHILGGTPFRKNYPQPGWTYDASIDAFYSPQPFPSWVLNTTTGMWDAPIARPSDDFMFATTEYNAETEEWEVTNGKDKYYFWDESVYQGDNTKGWVEA